jgi:hypothetical protein
MKRAILSILSALFVLCGYAEDFWQNYEFELFDGASVPLGGYHDGTVDINWSTGLESRYFPKGGPWNCGIFLSLDCAKYTFDGVDGTLKNRSASFGVSGGYTFRPFARVNPFISLYTGASYNNAIGNKYIPVREWSGMVMPRIGIELERMLRISIYCFVARKGFNTIGLSIGYNFAKRSPAKTD